MATRRRASARESARERMLEAGFELLQEEPLMSNLTARAVSRRAGLTPGAFYYHWASQASYVNDLLTERLGEKRYQYLARVEKRVRGLIAKGATFDEILTKAAQWALDSIQRDAIFLVQMSLWGQHAADKQTREALAQLYREFNEHFVALYQQVLEATGLELRPPFTVEHVSTIITALVEGLVLQRRVDDTAVPHDLVGAALLALAASVVQPATPTSGLAEALREQIAHLHISETAAAPDAPGTRRRR